MRLYSFYYFNSTMKHVIVYLVRSRRFSGSLDFEPHDILGLLHLLPDLGRVLRVLMDLNPERRRVRSVTHDESEPTPNIYFLQMLPPLPLPLPSWQQLNEEHKKHTLNSERIGRCIFFLSLSFCSCSSCINSLYLP